MAQVMSTNSSSLIPESALGRLVSPVRELFYNFIFHQVSFKQKSYILFLLLHLPNFIQNVH
jgi:hypothetical protein